MSNCLREFNLLFEMSVTVWKWETERSLLMMLK